MTFDSTISKDVSLSKVLDAFIIEHEKPEVIVTFLKQHEEAFQDILKYSLHYSRLFQLDFFLTCSDDIQLYIISKLKCIHIADASRLIWQILKSNSGKVQHIKYNCKKTIKSILDYDVRHPYSFGHKRYIEALDNLCFTFAKSDRIAEIPRLVDNSKLSEYFKNLSYSLFKDRLMQYDFVSALDDLAKYVFINCTFADCDIKSTICLALQILDSDEDIEVKKLVFDKLYSTVVPTHIIDDKTLDIICKCSSFSELMLKMTIFNSDVSAFVVLYLLLFKPNWIAEWAEYDENELNSYLNISELVKQYVKNG